MKYLLLLSLIVASQSALVYVPPQKLNELHAINSKFIQTAAEFDLYLFATSWQAEFCAHKDYPGCSNPLPFWQTHFTIHGLWPELNEGPHPGFCPGAEPFDPSQISAEVRKKLIQYWPDVKYEPSSENYDQFWEHEWKRHGTCSGLNQTAFFESALRLITSVQDTPAIIQKNVGKQGVSVAEIKDAYGGEDSVVLKCVHGKILSQVFTCWDKDSNSIPSKKRSCPNHVLQEDTCFHSEVSIPGFSRM